MTSFLSSLICSLFIDLILSGKFPRAPKVPPSSREHFGRVTASQTPHHATRVSIPGTGLELGVLYGLSAMCQAVSGVAASQSWH